jgi:aminoglycoside/choline kinase family phosphotransferase
MDKDRERYIVPLFEHWAGGKPLQITPLPQSGSYREYYRIESRNATAIGVFNADQKENVAFVEFTKHFHQKGLPVPALYAENLAHHVYLLQDLGDITLFAYLKKIRQNEDFPAELLAMYKQVIAQLPRFQIVAGQDLNYEVCYPRAHFDKQSMVWDLNYFKYYFLKLAKVPFDEQLLEDDFQRFTDYLLQTDCNFFLYRDFQSRNVMLYQGEPYFIDYQGGRRGALPYDLASLLYDAKADLPPQIRAELLDYYLQTVSQFIALNEKEFIHYFYGYVLIRMMQAMGAYGFRGFYERKSHFLESIPYALKSLQWVLDQVTLAVEIPTLIAVLHQLVNSAELKQISMNSRPTPNPSQEGNTSQVVHNKGAEQQETIVFPSWEGLGVGEPLLTVTITSFSYKRGIPVDETGHGGGYVFDCRALPNPGRYEQYAELTGKDEAVIGFLESALEVRNFLEHIYGLMDQTIEDYQQRQRAHLMVNFGCTGGRHRSVYCAEMLAKHLREKYEINITLRHLEQEG